MRRDLAPQEKLQTESYAYGWTSAGDAPRGNDHWEDDVITVMGATGNTGRKIAEVLRRTGEGVRALGRSQGRLDALRTVGAEVLTGDAADAAFLAKAFHGADAVCALLPTDRRSPDYRARQDREGEAIVSAIRRAGVRCVVALSSLSVSLRFAAVSSAEWQRSSLSRSQVTATYHRGLPPA